MRRTLSWSAATLCIALLTPTVSADVKTREKSLVSLEGVLGGMVRMFGGRAARDGVESTSAVKGNRKLTMTNTTGRLVDLTEEKAYEIDVRRKEFTVRTFAELRAEFEKAKAEAQKQKASATPEEKAQMEEAGRQLEFDVKVTETGQTKTLAGHNTREVAVEITGREKGKTLDEGGGFVMTSTMWLAPRLAALDELGQFELRAAQAIYGQEFAADMQALATMVSLYPSFAEMSKRLQAENKKLQGTALSTSVVFEAVKSAEQMKAAAEQQPSSGGGLSGALARRMMGNRGAPQQRTKVLTTTHDVLSVDTTVADADVELPAGFKQKK